MKSLLLIFSFLLSINLFGATDPYDKVDIVTLKNGLKVYLTPMKGIDKIKVFVRIYVGFNDETKEYYSASHFLEHMLFRAKSLKDDASYLSLIKEKGGKGNGTTLFNRTEYYASLNSSEASWLVDTFYKMIHQPNFNKDLVEKERRAVLLEIGYPSPVESLFGVGFTDIIPVPWYLNRGGFWYQNFGIRYNQKYLRAAERYNTQKLHSEQLLKHYHRYYHPKNIRLFVTGKFNKRKILKQIESTWGKVDKTGETIDHAKHIINKTKEYYSSSISSDTPHIKLGHKFYDIELEDHYIYSSYYYYLAHRLQKEFRNKRGETYSVNMAGASYLKSGYYAVSLSATRDNYNDSLSYIQDLIDSEVEKSNLTEKTYKETIEFYKKQIYESSKNVNQMESKAIYLEDKFYDFGIYKSPIKVIESISFEQFKKHLSKLAKKHYRYSSLTRPNAFFRYDGIVLSLLSFIYFFIFFKRKLSNRFEHTQVRWVRSIKYPPIKILEFFVFLVAILIYSHLQTILDLYIFDSVFLRKLPFSDYFFMIVVGFLITASYQACCSILARKLYIMNDKLIIKYLSYRSVHIPLNSIKSVEVMNPFAFIFSKGFIKNIFHFYFYYFFKPWKAGLVVKTYEGQEYLFSFKNANLVKRELQSYLDC